MGNLAKPMMSKAERELAGACRESDAALRSASRAMARCAEPGGPSLAPYMARMEAAARAERKAWEAVREVRCNG